MKIVLLNPRIRPEQGLVKTLQTQGAAVLLPMDATEAWQMLQLHGASIDLAIIHREGGGTQADAGLRFIAKVKADPSQADLPIVLTSEIWTNTDFVQHQQSPSGVNAYLTYPFTQAQLFSIIEAVTGQKFIAGLEETGPATDGTQSEDVSGAPEPDPSGLSLEDAGSIFGKPEKLATGPSIHLEAPEFTGSMDFKVGANSNAPAPDRTSVLVRSGKPAQELELTAGGLTIEPSVATELPEFESSAHGVQGVPAVTPPAEPSAAEIIEPSVASDVAAAAATTEDVALSPEESLAALHSVAPEATRTPTPAPVQDAQAMEEMPYLFGNTRTSASPPPPPEPTVAAGMARPIGDSVVPGGAAQAPDTETLKKYLLLREQDVAVLSSKSRSQREQIEALEKQLREERGKSVELTHQNSEFQRRLDGFEREKGIDIEGLHKEIEELRFQMKTKTDKARLMEGQVRAAADEMEKLKERVRSDIRKIRVREKELENRLEIVKKDSEAVLAARENKIIELKRKLDMLEFNMDLLQDQLSREKENSLQLREKLAKAAQVVRVAGGLLGPQDENSEAAPGTPGSDAA